MLKNVSPGLIENVKDLKISLNELTIYDLSVYSSIEIYYKVAHKLNEVITELSRFEGVLSEEVVKQNEKLIYLLGEGLENEVIEEIDKLIQNKFFENLLNVKIFNDLNSKLEQKANKDDVFSMANMGQDVKEAMTGGSVAVVGKNTILTENIVNKQVTENKVSFMEDTSLLKNNTFMDGGIWFNGTIKVFNDWSYINEVIKINPNTTYYIIGATDFHIDILSDDGSITRHIAGDKGHVFSTFNNETGIKVSFLKNEKENVSISIYKNNFQFYDYNLDRFTKSLIKFNNENAFLNKKGYILVDNTSLTINELRFISTNGAFYQTKEASVVFNDLQGEYDYIVMTLTENILTGSEYGNCYEIVLEKGSYSSVWQGIPNLDSNQRILCFKNDGKWNSLYNNINSQLNISNENEIVTIEKVVKQNGQIGVDCDYTDIKEALKSINDNGYYKRYKIKVYDGEYDYSNDGENIGVPLKNYVEIEGINKATTIIKKLDNSFDWSKACVDINDEDIEYSKIKGFTLISNNCKCPLHIDSYRVKGTFIGEDLDLINLQTKGTGDYPTNGSPNCGAFGVRSNEHIILKNVRANGKLWGHNYCDTNSNSTIEFINCNSKKLQFGDLTSQGNDKIIVKGCKADIFEHLWFSEYESLKGRKPSFEFTLEGNNINKTVLGDHANKHNALDVYFKGKYPFNLAEIHTYCYCSEDVKINDLVYEKDFTNLFEVTKTNNGKLIGRVIENTTNNMVLVEKVNN